MKKNLLIVVLAVVVAGLGYYLYQRAERKARENGTLTQY